MKWTKATYRVMLMLGAMVAVFASISFIDKRDVGFRMDDISVEIEHSPNSYFVDEDDVMELVMRGERDSVLGDQFGRVNLRAIEQRIESHSFIREAEVFRDLKGHLVVRAYQRKPIARLVSPGGEHAYISEKGVILPVSSKYTARVVVLSGPYMSQLLPKESVMTEEIDRELFNLVNFIRADRFWQMQIGEIHVDKKGKVVLYPQVGRQKLELGRATDLKNKFMRLKIFFKEIMPTKGWNAYKRVNVEFEDQIICE